MKFRISRASDVFEKAPPVASAVREDGKYWVEVNSLEELMTLMANAGNDLIVSMDHITIHDDYVE